jgi:Pyruvate/2-oxoacid:ferredoxin oxidoreductase delta subunit
MSIYEKLREKMNSCQPFPVPATESKVELDILRSIITEEEAEIALNLSGLPEDIPTISQRAGIEPEKLKPVLDSLTDKGAIFKVYGDNPLYSLTGMIIGIFEFQVGTLTAEKAKLFEKYYAEKLGEAIFSNDETQVTRVLPVNKSITPELEIFTHEEVNRLIDDAESVAIADCICRKSKNMLNEGCKAPVKDICLLLNSMGDHYANKGIGRAATKNEAKEVIRRAEEAGLIHNTLNSKTGQLFICNCCSCCCALLRGISELNIPGAVVKSNFMPVVSADDCSGCEECVDSCQMKAIEVVDSLAVISDERCLGCGICVSKCSLGAISLKRREESLTPPETLQELMGKYAGGRRM